MPIRSSTCYYRISLGQWWDKLKLMYQDLTMQYGKVNTHETWGWEDLALKAGSTTDYMTSNSNKFRIPSSMILMMVFTLCIPLEKRKKMCVCMWVCMCTITLDKGTQKTVIFIFTGNCHCSKPTSRAHNWKIAHNSSAIMARCFVLLTTNIFRHFSVDFNYWMF